MFKRAALILVVVLFVYILNAFLFPFPKKNVPEGFRPQYGVSYSFEQAGWYGYDGRVEFIKLLDEVKFDWVRLTFFWDQMVDENGEFNKNFEDLEFAIEEAGKRDVKVVLALGLKTPHYPEYHLPKNIAEQIMFGEKVGAGHPVADELIATDQKVVSRLSKYENIIYWQVENEPYLANINNIKIDRSLVEAEVKAVRNADIRRRAVILSYVGPAVFDRGWMDLAEVLEPGDVFAVNAYFKTQGVSLFALSLFDRQIKVPWPKFLTWPVQSWYFMSPNFGGIRESLARRNVDLWVLEMQAEPYVRNLEYARSGDFYFGPDDIFRADRFLRGQRIESVGLWGANFWIYRDKLGDRRWIDAVKGVVN